MTDWPTLDQTIASILEEETRLSNQITAPQENIDNRAALSPANKIQSGNGRVGAPRIDYAKRTRVVCDHCKNPGHVKGKCFDLVGYPLGWQRKPYSGFTRGGNMRSTDRAQFTSSREEQSVVTAHALEEFKAKLMATNAAGPSETTPDAHTGKGSNQMLTSWIIDSGATNHMTGSSKFFSTYIPRSGRDRVRIADGSSAPIMGSGNITCTPTLPLSPVLHVPNFPVDLLSVSSITKSLNCRVSFEPYSCIFQDLKTGRLLATGVEDQGLYYLNNAQDPYALNVKDLCFIK
uniref:Uncharacterized protein n=1 Tax=Avena sativa TaxID=4498 RepID=A0ACD6AQ01_AVESA